MVTRKTSPRYKKMLAWGIFKGESNLLGCINGKGYLIIGETEDCYNVVDETEEDYVYSKEFFEIIEILEE